MTTTNTCFIEGYFADDNEFIVLEDGDLRYPELFQQTIVYRSRALYLERKLDAAQKTARLLAVALGLALGAVALMWFTSGCPFHSVVGRAVGLGQ